MQSFDRPPLPVTRASAWIQRYAGLVPAGGPVLDLACGDGRHARYFRDRGHPVTAVDIHLDGVQNLAGNRNVTLMQADLEGDPWPFAPASFAGIVIANYLHRPHFPLLPVALQPGGVLLMETFAAGNEKLGRPRNPDFLLAAGELLAAFGTELQVVAYEHGSEAAPRPAVRQRLVAVKAADPVALPDP